MAGDSGGDARLTARDSFLLMTVLRDERDCELGPARIRNLSQTGMMVDTTVPLVTGQKLRFDLRGIGLVSGEVVRREVDQFGIMFDECIDPRLARKPLGTGTREYLHPPAYRF